MIYGKAEDIAGTLSLPPSLPPSLSVILFSLSLCWDESVERISPLPPSLPPFPDKYIVGYKDEKDRKKAAKLRGNRPPSWDETVERISQMVLTKEGEQVIEVRLPCLPSLPLSLPPSLPPSLLE